MPLAQEIAELSPDAFIWQSYDSAVKADLSSSALVFPSGMVVVDPIPLAEEALTELHVRGVIAAIVVTNANHHRACADFADRFSTSIFSHADSFPTGKPSRFTEVRGGDEICDRLRVIAIDGAPPGEIALYHPAGAGTLIIGDALINFEPHGFTLLPAKYCSNAAEMRRALHQLIDCNAERILFAHGTPILSGGRQRLRRLLDVETFP